MYLNALRKNYGSMFNNFIAIDTWNSLYGQFVVVLPLFLASPKMFVQQSGVGLGELQLLRHMFSDVFFSLNAFAFNWPRINDLRATARRLEAFHEAAAATRPYQPTKPSMEEHLL